MNKDVNKRTNKEVICGFANDNGFTVGNITLFETVLLFLRLCYVLRLLRCSYVICVLHVPKLQKAHLMI